MNDYQATYKFDNGYGASVVSSVISYGGNKGLFEVGVLDSDGELVYDTPITNDVVGWCSFAEVAEILERIKSLPKKN
jgi:hypothetical protein